MMTLFGTAMTMTTLMILMFLHGVELEGGKKQEMKCLDGQGVHDEEPLLILSWMPFDLQIEEACGLEIFEVLDSTMEDFFDDDNNNNNT